MGGQINYATTLYVLLEIRKVVSDHPTPFISLQLSDPSDTEIDLMKKINQLIDNEDKSPEFETYLEKIRWCGITLFNSFGVLS
ncbi:MULTISPECIES: hypothetical protein [unclassified Pseudoalteromonas]|uniref:hypothetical protein n=1 Tax=unclassified Pseudoalteromonas TaxID=194690 RepID=UPI001603A978|nr:MULTISPECIES: hypothetical protein [unclassified Pseudoalteromonas]MBB1308003.1 hypothetical protein [Pseudoalteromonas sp. SR41-8]MBB1410852.1 hypothetical protein [Pseudoalteromonas sp. SG44-17]